LLFIVAFKEFTIKPWIIPIFLPDLKFKKEKLKWVNLSWERYFGEGVEILFPD
jgi:hypothetical protein